jgi:hypothetical protein
VRRDAGDLCVGERREQTLPVRGFGHVFLSIRSAPARVRLASTGGIAR